MSVFCAQCCDVRYLCLFAYSGVQHISVLCFFFVFLCLVYSMLPVSLGCSGLLIFFFCSFVLFLFDIRILITLLYLQTLLTRQAVEYSSISDSNNKL